MARKKVKGDAVHICSLQEASDALSVIAHHQRFIAEKTNEMNERIDAIKQETVEALRARQEEIARREAGLQAFAESRKAELFSKTRSRDLVYGVIGFRRSTRLKTLAKVTWKKVLETLLAKKGRPGVRVKYEVDKDELRNWGAAYLRTVGVEIVAEDTFFYEIREEEIKVHAGNE